MAEPWLRADGRPPSAFPSVRLMFDLHSYVAAEKQGDAIRLLDGLDGVRHATALPAASDGTVQVMAEVDAGAAEEVLQAPRGARHPLRTKSGWRGAAGSSQPAPG